MSRCASSQYESSIVDFTQLLFSQDEKERRIAMFGAYFDDSAMPGQNPELLCMACYVAPSEQWDHFTPDWQAMLKHYDISAVHMTDLSNKREEFKGWSQEKEKKLLQDAHKLINAHTEVGASIAVDMRAYSEVMPIYLNDLFGGPYGFCAFQCMQYLLDQHELRGWSERIAMFFEVDSGYGKQIDTFKRQIVKNPLARHFHSRIIGRIWSFVDKIEYPQLQAADVLAYESNKLWYNYVCLPEPLAPRASLQNLLRADRDFGMVYDRDKLERSVRVLLSDD